MRSVGGQFWGMLRQRGCFSWWIVVFVCWLVRLPSLDQDHLSTQTKRAEPRIRQAACARDVAQSPDLMPFFGA
jgi:hypothetical protein